MKKGQETGLTILISVIVLMLIILQYFIFFVFFPEIISPKFQQETESEIDLELLTFTRSNSNLIIISIKNNDYNELEDEIKKLYSIGDCVNLQINKKLFREKDCENQPGGQLGISPTINYKKSTINIPDYNNNKINITLKIKNE